MSDGCSATSSYKECRAFCYIRYAENNAAQLKEDEEPSRGLSVGNRWRKNNIRFHCINSSLYCYKY